jgi:hypothetical protein
VREADSVPVLYLQFPFLRETMPEERDCFVKLVDDHGVEHSVKVRAESYEAALNGLKKLERVCWEPLLGFSTPLKVFTRRLIQVSAQLFLQ